jgi:hypothetical protein
MEGLVEWVKELRRLLGETAVITSLEETPKEFKNLWLTFKELIYII